MIKLILNGKETLVASDNLFDLVVNEKKLAPEHVVAELNTTIIKREKWRETPLKDGDRLELVSFVGGG